MRFETLLSVNIQPLGNFRDRKLYLTCPLGVLVVPTFRITLSLLSGVPVDESVRWRLGRLWRTANVNLEEDGVRSALVCVGVCGRDCCCHCLLQ